MKQCENVIRKAVDECGYCVSFLATPVYTGAALIPDRLIITVQNEGSSGNAGVNCVVFFIR